MYKGQTINLLLSERGIKKKELMNYLGWSSYQQFKQTIDGNPSVQTIEKIADFLGVSIDTFFERKEEVSTSILSSEEIISRKIKQNLHESETRIATLTALLAEKDKQIKLQHDMIDLLKNQNSDKK